MTEKDDKQKDQVDESIDLTHQEKIEGQLECLKEMNRILKGAIERHETNRDNN
jgi:hypothetical protein